MPDETIMSVFQVESWDCAGMVQRITGSLDRRFRKQIPEKEVSTCHGKPP